MAKKLSLKKILKPGLMLFIPVFFGCDTQNDLGIKYDLGSGANVKFIEFTLPATNIYLDSLRTDGENRVLVGSYTDPLTGTVDAEGYFQFSYENGPLPREKATTTNGNPVDTLKVDSLVIIFEVNEIIPQRGNSFQEFGIHELTNSLVSNAIYLSNLQQSVSGQVGSFSQSINTVTDTLYRVRLDDTYAADFFNELSDIAGDTTRTIGAAEFKPLGLIPGGASESIASFSLASDTSRLVLYSSPRGPDAKDTTYLTYFRLTTKNYTYLNRDRSGSEYDGIMEKQDFDISTGQTLLDPISGISTAFDLTELASFYNENDNILINNATISFEFESENDRDTLTGFMNYIRKSDKGIFGPASVNNPFGNIVMSDNGYLGLEVIPATGNLSESKTSILLTSSLFYQQLYREFVSLESTDSLKFRNPLTSITKNVEDLVLVSNTDVTLKRTLLTNDGIKLKLYYTEVDQ
ncbi:DUF4270 family protein [Ekhidna sp.]|uniref:DUF4270 family protein n=1 Tax=Ekhidna sp. TaxID=2608089 RepID=UPI0032982A10